MIDLDDIKRRFKATDYWNKYHSDIILEVNLVLTEPVCPQATIRFELTKRQETGIIAQCYGDTIEEAIDKAVNQAIIRLESGKMK